MKIPESGRRSFLRGVLGAGAVAAAGYAGAATAQAATGDAAAASGTDPLALLGPVPFHGTHQAGILLAPQRQAIVVSFDATAASRPELTDVLQALTSRARILTAGGTPDPAGSPGRPRTRDPRARGAPGRADGHRRPGGLAVR